MTEKEQTAATMQAFYTRLDNLYSDARQLRTDFDRLGCDVSSGSSALYQMGADLDIISRITDNTKARIRTFLQEAN